MPADHLIPAIDIPAPALADAVLAVLRGADQHATAAACGITTTQLAAATRTYQDAGLAALHQPTDHSWYEVRIQFPDWHGADNLAAHHLGPHLDRLTADGAIRDWWFLWKHPCWRLRMAQANIPPIHHILDTGVATGVIQRWWPTLYEPETTAFGGHHAITTVHTLFCADSRGVLDYLRRDTPALGRRELSILLLSGLLDGAGLDTFERGDVFSKVAALRPPPGPTAPVDQLADQLQALLTIPNLTDSALFAPGGPTAYAAPWLTAHHTAGRELARAASAGRLTRGLRAILSQIIIFHWNRLRLPATTQAALATAARIALLP